MKNIQLILVFFILLQAGLVAQTSTKSRFIKPTNFQKRVTTNIADKSRAYYSLSQEDASIISVNGPGILRVITRGRFAPQETDKINYEFFYSVNGAGEESIEFSSVSRSKKATYKNGNLGVPGQMKDFEMELGRGSHTIEFKLENDQVPVAVRYQFTAVKAKKQEWMAYSPLTPCEPVELISRESTVKYYRFSNEKPLKIEICGPTELRMLTRIENHYQMKGRILYRLQVKQEGKVINTYQLSSRRSEIAMYKEDKELIPGKAREFVINVPKGKHVYEIIPLDKDKSTVLGRCLFPEKDVNLKH